MEARFCHNCGAKLKENTKFCGICGTPVLRFPEPGPEAAAPAFQPEPETPETAIPEPTPVAPEPTPVTAEPEPAAVEPEPPVAAAEPEPVPAAPESVPAVPEPVPVVPEPVPVVSEPVPAAPEYVPVMPEPEPAVRNPEPAPSPVTYAPPEQPEAPVQKKKNRYPARGAGRTILAVLLCILIFIWSFAALGVYDIRRTLSGDALKDSVQDAFESVDVLEIPASSVITDVKDPDQSLAGWITEEIQAGSSQIELTEEELAEFLEKSTVLPFLSEKLAACVNDVYSGAETSGITEEEIDNLIQENAPLIEEAIGRPLQESEIQELTGRIQESGITEYLTAGTLKQEIAPVYHGMRFAVSYWVIGFFCFLALICILLLSKANRWNMLRTCGDLGITWAVLCGVMLLAALFANLAPDVWSTVCGSGAVGSMTGSVLFSGMIPTLILLGVSVLLILIKVIGKRIVTKSAKAQV